MHAEIDTRLARVAQIGAAHLARVTEELGARIRAPAGESCLVVWNPHAGGLAQAEGVVELDLGPRGRRPPPIHLRDAAGRRIPVRAELEEPGAVLARTATPSLADGARLLEIDDPEILLTALEPRPGGRTELRLLNASAQPRRVFARWNGRGGALERVDLRGEPLPGADLASAADGGLKLDLRPWEIAGLRTRPGPEGPE